MSTFGGYVTVSELSRSGLGSVYSAVPAGAGGAGTGGAPRHAVKTCQPDAGILGEDAAAQAVARFVEHAETQRDISARPECQSRWAKVHEIGKFEADGNPGAFVVVDLGTRGSFEKLASGRVRLEATVLSRLLREVVGALRDLDGVARRGHGALKANNVLLIGDTGSELTSCRVALTDPLPQSQAEIGRDRLADLRAVGEMIHALVLHQKFRGGWPVEPSAPWAAMGASGGKWRELVNQLLDPNDKAARPTLEELDTVLGTLGEVKRSRKPLIIGIAAVALFAGGVTTAVLWPKPKTDPDKPVLTFTKWNEETKKRWEQLCLAYSGWYDLFQSKLDEPPGEGLRERGFDTRRKAYAALDPQLKSLLELPGVGAGFDPWSIAGVKRDASARQLSGMLSDEVRSDAAVEKTEGALEAIDAMRKGLIEGWGAPKKLEEAARVFREQLGAAAATESAARHLEDIAKGVQFNEATDVAAVVDRVLGVMPTIDKVESSMSAARASGEALKAAGDPLLARFGEQVAAMVAGGAGTAGTGRDALSALERSALRVAETGSTLEKYVKEEWPRIETEDLFASPAYAELKARPITPELFTEWTVAASRHPSLKPEDDPRRGVDFGAAVASLDEQRRRFTSEPLSGEVDPALTARLSKIRADVGAIDSTTLVWKRKNEQAVRTQTAAVKKELDELRVALGSLIDARAAELSATATEFRNALRGRNELVAGSAAVNGAWRTLRDGLVGFADAQYSQTRAKAKAIEDRLTALEKSDFEPAIDPAEAGAAQTDWAQQLAVAAAGERERQIAGVLAAPGGTPDVIDPAFNGRVAAAASTFKQWQAGVRQMRTELAAAESALNAGTDADGGQLDAAVAKWSASEIGKQPAVASAIGGLKARVMASKALATETSIEALLDKVRRPDTKQPELARAAWKRLGDADVGWPKTLAQAQTVKEVSASVRGVISGLSEAQRSAALSQLGADLAARWERFALGVTTPRDMEAALALMPDFEVDPTRIDNRLKHNVAIVEMKREVAATGVTDGRASQLAGSFATRVRGFGINAPAIASMLKGVDEIAQNKEPERPTIDPRTLGPGSMGGRFTAAFDAATMDLRFSSGGVTIEFVRVDLGADNAVYIASRELSIGEMVAIAGGGGIQQIAEDSPPGAEARGPRGWTWTGNNVLGRATLWILKHPLMTPATPAYGPGVAAAGTEAGVSDQAGGDPSLEHPAQSMSPVSLGVVARLAGCRFLTASEWKAAAQQFNAGGVAGANLRDQAFERQRAHVAAMRAQAGPAEDAFQWPDNGAFLPNNPPSEAAARARAENDGILWFTRTSIGPGARVKNLVGNVAEFVISDGPAMERTQATSAALSGMLERAGLAVIGGSALSDPQLAVDQAQTVSLFDSAEGLSDVGVRLAFNASGTAPPKEPLIERLRKLVTDEAFVLGK